MSLQQLRNVNFGLGKSNATGSTGVGYTVIDSVGAMVTARTTTGVYQLTSGSGMYAAFVTFPDAFHGQLMWDTGTAFPTASYAVEEYNVEQNNPNVDNVYSVITQMSGTLAQLYDINFGRWQIVANQMIFYKEDGVTVVATFNLFDDTGTASMDSVFERVKA